MDQGDVQNLRNRQSAGQSSASSETDAKQDHAAVQKSINSQVWSAIVVAGLILVVGYQLVPVPVGLSALSDRLMYTIRWQLPSVLLLVFSIQRVADTRFSSTALNPIEGDQHHVVLYKNFLTNTMEQFVINASAQQVLTTYLTPRQMVIIPLLVLVFIIARMFYWHGYKNPSFGRSNRAFGFAMSFSVTALVLFYCVYRFVWDLFYM